jgi:LysM repeat protein
MVLVRSQGRGSGERGALDASARIRRAANRLAELDGIEKLVPVGLCAILVAAALASSLPEAPAASAAGQPTSAAAVAAAQLRAAAPIVQFGQGDGPLASDFSDIYLGDGSIPNTLQNPGAGIDARTLLRTYTVVAGDTLSGIAARFGLATSTIYWANRASLPNPASLRVGQQLLIPPMDGLLVKVGVKDTLASLAAKYKVTAQDIVDANNLPDTNLVLGETVLIPGASGGQMPVARTSSGGGGGTVRAGGWIWPVDGNSYISQYFWSGHHAIDIAASSGTPVVAAEVRRVGWLRWRPGHLGNGRIEAVYDLQPPFVLRRAGRSEGSRRPEDREGRPDGQRHRPASPFRGLARLPVGPRHGRRRGEPVPVPGGLLADRGRGDGEEAAGRTGR